MTKFKLVSSTYDSLIDRLEWGINTLATVKATIASLKSISEVSKERQAQWCEASCVVSIAKMGNYKKARELVVDTYPNMLHNTDNYLTVEEVSDIFEGVKEGYEVLKTQYKHEEQVSE